MTTRRSNEFRKDEVGTYHCVSRCVRRAFLCGVDTYSGVSYEHRRSWVRSRLALLVEGFCIELIAYAVMSNHLHSMIRNRPDLAQALSAEEVARRWRKLFPKRSRDGRTIEPSEEEIVAIADNAELVTKYRSRLSDISWFNRCLCEHIARRANREDDCTGRFWEGRFKAQRVEDTGALLACGVYIDLNPIRAGIAASAEESEYTSVQDRILALKGVAPTYPTPTLLSIEEASGGAFCLHEYLSLLDATGRILVQGKGAVSPQLADILVRLKIRPENWLDTTTNLRSRFRRIVGSFDSIRNAARKFQKKWFQGLSAAKVSFT